MTPRESVLDAIQNTRNALITTHRNPDGDAIGSSLAVYHGLRMMGKSARVLLPNASPRNLLWLPGASDMFVYGDNAATHVAEADTIFVLDLNAASRLDALGELIVSSSATIVNIDHHTHPERFAQTQWIDVEACSTAFMIADIFQELGVCNPSIAQCLYTGIMTDTGSFRFPRTTEQVFRCAAWLVDNGADPVRCYDEVMNNGTIGRTKLMGKCLSQMMLVNNNAVCIISVSAEDLNTFACTTEDTEGFVSQTLALQGVTMGILLVELPGEIKISFRSKGTTYVRDLAASFGGGGHVYAAGARYSGGTIQSAIEQILKRITDTSG